MKIYLFYHSVISDWNHGDAHFLRGVMKELIALGHHIKAFEARDNWALTNLIKEQGMCVLNDFRRKFPELMPEFYNPGEFDPSGSLSDADLVIVHEWNDPGLIKKIGAYRAECPHFTLLFHDTHHRAVTKPFEMEMFELRNYDGVLVSCDVLKKKYMDRSWSKKVWTWHEAADTRLFRPLEASGKEGDLVWIGNWGDYERTEELIEFIINPVKVLELKAVIYGVRFPELAIRLMGFAGIEYRGWLPNDRVPEIFSRYRFTVHLPSRPYNEPMPGIATIRPFEAMASGIPLICSGWKDPENLFRAGEDFLMVQSGAEMVKAMSKLLHDRDMADSLSRNGLETIHNRHTCRHRAAELIQIEELARLPQRFAVQN
jgi:spore maturation protein CgeB